MKIAVWKTGHEIADRVAQSLAEGFDAEGIFGSNTLGAKYWKLIKLPIWDAHIGYGILRGTAGIFKECDRIGLPWFNIDRGYFNPRHFDGTYRISYRGTQAKWHEGIPRKPVDIKLDPWRTNGDYVLICPPTQAVCDFFGIDLRGWEMAQVLLCYQSCMPARWRQKGSITPIEEDLTNARAVITFNSSIGWQAMQKGIPVLSDPDRSAIGSFYNCRTLQSLTDKLHDLPDNRIELFEAMQAHQFTLAEIEQGKAWDLVKHYLSTYSSDTMIEKPLPPMSAPIASSAAPDQTLKSIFSNTGN